MSIKDGILAELNHETNNTRRVLNNLTQEHWDYKPHEKSMTLGQLAAHVVELHTWVSTALDGDSFDFHSQYQPLAQTDLESLKNTLDEYLQKNIEYVNSVNEEEWFKEWTLKAGDHVISQLPKLAALRYILNNHLIHHRGQLTVYMRILDLPLPGIYGPSADER